jgi:hypothetical protein
MGIAYVNHMKWVNFTAAGLPKPLAIQMLRHPIARQSSVYYYTMFGPRPEESMQKARMQHQRLTGLDRPPTFNEYMTARQRALNTTGCQQAPFGNPQTQYFCGFDPLCDNICSPAALELAKRVLSTE